MDRGIFCRATLHTRESRRIRFAASADNLRPITSLAVMLTPREAEEREKRFSRHKNLAEVNQLLSPKVAGNRASVDFAMKLRLYLQQRKRKVIQGGQFSFYKRGIAKWQERIDVNNQKEQRSFKMGNMGPSLNTVFQIFDVTGKENTGSFEHLIKVNGAQNQVGFAFSLRNYPSMPNFYQTALELRRGPTIRTLLDFRKEKLQSRKRLLDYYTNISKQHSRNNHV